MTVPWCPPRCQKRGLVISPGSCWDFGPQAGGTKIDTSANHFRCRYFTAIGCAIIAATILFCAFETRQQHFITCTVECGETFLAHRAAQQFESDGFRFALLENLGTSGSKVTMSTMLKTPYVMVASRRASRRLTPVAENLSCRVDTVSAI